MPTRKIFSTAMLIMCALVQQGSAQSLPDSLVKKIDLHFKKWDRAEAPGCVVGIVRNDSLLYAKGFGLANLENSVPNTTKSVYYMCSVSKQFAGYAIVLLARQGKVKLDEDIRVYLPWMNIPGKKITVRHLLNHTSGIRDDIGLAAISGLGMDGMLTQDLALNILKKQRSLNFEPGERYAYSNSNYVLLAEIAATAAGQDFKSFTDSAIFRPLGMASTRFVDHPEEMLQGRAASYSFVPLDKRSGRRNFFENSYQNVYTLGDGGLFTSLEDMSKWVMNIFSPKSGDRQDIAQLAERGRLNNGQEISYALGIAVDSSRGWKRYIHNGSLAGYRTLVVVYPDLKTGFIVFGNGGDNEVYGRGENLATFFIPDIRAKQPASTAARRDSGVTFLTDTNAVKAFLGSYIADDGFQAHLSLKKNQLWLNGDLLLVPERNDTFSLLQNPAIRYAFFTGSAGEQAGAALVTPASPGAPIQFAKMKTTTMPLQSFTGTYYCPELECSYGIAEKNGRLYLTSNKHNDALIRMMDDDHLITEHPMLDHLQIRRGAGKKITGFELNSRRIMHLVFNKIN
ncbi:class A beta-lactamase-related serine hydrolase [Chitinophaga lutea]|uniref:Class A beta-lactamase-related serine hydrolase n=1 Tax=Chitinophaga lutea TaxID=2488634 RepID=A0A3N4PVB9_9BACT|nr:serine hydrolase domain-containing protein [Chitinophaga lutea]RPE08097.1 class A beta-lactamase-related serine hydrolase [Chitinophaga lutea]